MKPLKYEVNYTITALECLEIIDAIDKWQLYINEKPFTVVMIYEALEWLENIEYCTRSVPKVLEALCV